MTGTEEIWLIGGSVFDGTGRERFRADVKVAAGVITEIVPGGVDLTTSVRTIDISGSTVIPGLIDAHSHVGLLKLVDQSTLAPAVQAAHIFRNLSLSLDQGFTTLRDLGGVDGGLVEAVEQGLVEGPTILPSGEMISQTAGHGDSRSRFGHETCNPQWGSGLAVAMRIADGVADVQRAARDQFRRGATQLKIFATGGQLSEGDPIDSPQYSESELSAAVEVAEDRNTYVTVHAHTVRGIQRALRAGVRCFEHATLLDAETVAMMRDCGAVAVPTLTVLTVLRDDPERWGIPEEWLKNSQWLEDAAATSIEMMDAAGIPMGSGADLVGLEQNMRGWEITLKAEILGSSKAVQSATRVNAEILRIDHLVGTVQVGKHADIVVYEGDPIADPTLFASHNPSLVMKRGKVVRNLRLATLATCSSHSDAGAPGE